MDLSVAIHIGDTYSTYAWCVAQNILNIQCRQWAREGVKVGLKTPTALLLNPDKSFNSFGYDAEGKYADMAEEEDEDQSNYYYFRNLHNVKKFNKGAKIKDETGKTFPVFDIFVHSIRFLQEDAISGCPVMSYIMSHDIMYVLAIPARWGYNGKQYMRKAAEKAGIYRDSLMVVLEPEVAVLSCHSEENVVNRFFYEASKSEAAYIVVDLGGRTADISYHRHGGLLSHLLPSEGSKLGGNNVNDEFMTFLGQITGEKHLEQLKKENLDDYLEILSQFEKRKKMFSSGKGYVHMQIIAAINSVKVADMNVSRFNGSVICVGDKLGISEEQFRRLFEKTLNAIETSIERIIHDDRFKAVEYILMVGEFSECELVQSAIRNRFPQKSIIVPREQDIAVAEGALLFGFISNNRETRFTYGIEHWPEFIKTRHPLDKMVVIDGIARCKDVFFKYIEGGQMVPKNRRVSYVCRPFASCSTTLDCTVYVSAHRDPRFTDDVGCAVLGVLHTPFTVDRERAVVEIEQTLIFGETCITLQAKDLATGQVCETQIEYM